MSTHDVLAYAVATEAVRRVRAGNAPWSSIFSSSAYITASRVWPVPDFVLVDGTNSISVAAEFKPPEQTKREYLTGLGQAIAYSRDFHYGLLVLPTIADDGYRIADHIVSVLQQTPFSAAPVGVLAYDPKVFSPFLPVFSEAHFFLPRTTPLAHTVSLDTSFYAKWREMSPGEVYTLLSYSYDEMRTLSSSASTIRDRAFSNLWIDIQAGKLNHWGGGVRHYGATATIKAAVAKNYRNFLFHIGWSESDGALTREGLNALHVGTLYGAMSRPFLDALAAAVLLDGKHLILFNAISEYQDGLKNFPSEENWLQELEEFLENKGLLKRNIGRAAAATAGSVRGFFKAEKQLWRQLELITPRGGRVFHPGRGLIFNWARITELVQSRST